MSSTISTTMKKNGKKVKQNLDLVFTKTYTKTYTHTERVSFDEFLTMEMCSVAKPHPEASEDVRKEYVACCRQVWDGLLATQNAEAPRQYELEDDEDDDAEDLLDEDGFWDEATDLVNLTIAEATNNRVDAYNVVCENERKAIYALHQEKTKRLLGESEQRVKEKMKADLAKQMAELQAKMERLDV